MQKLILKKLIVISNKEKKSREVPFKKGLNIILGANKTGKSSLIKSIFFTFGCRLKFEEEWKAIIDTFILFFQYGERDYCIIRQLDTFKVFSVEKETPVLLFEESDFHTYSVKLMNLMGIFMVCSKNSGEEISLTPPLLFRFQYVDQDNGWNKIGESFTNMQYIKDWKSNTNKYVVGFQGEEYYKAAQQKVLIKEELIELKTKINHFDEFIKKLQGIIKEENNQETFEHDQIIHEQRKLAIKIINEMDRLERKRIKNEEELLSNKNLRYEKRLEIQFVKKHINSLSKDHEYAIKEDEEIKCPFCGTVHKNSIQERTEIVKDIQTGNKLIQVYRGEIKQFEELISNTETEKRDIHNKYNMLKLKLEKVEEKVSIFNNLKILGQLSLIKDGDAERNNIETQYNDKLTEKEGIEEELKILKSRKKRDEIYKKLKEYYTKVLENLNIPVSYMKLNDFVQVLTRTGSEMPRMIYAYHVALYLYNLERANSPFNILVIDTPNQQGQDTENLQNIDSILSFLTTDEGQAIIGSERKTGFEEVANLITLTSHKNCLTEEKYQEHKDLLLQLENISVS